MRERAVGGYEPDTAEQNELHELWHLARGAAFAGQNAAELIAKHGSVRGAYIAWIVDEFLKKHAGERHVARKWIYVWCVDNVGVLVERTVTEVDARGRATVVGGQSWLSCCAFHATGGPQTKMCQDKTWEREKPQRVSDVVDKRELKLCPECKLPRLMHGTPMTDCEHFAERK